MFRSAAGGLLRPKRALVALGVGLWALAPIVVLAALLGGVPALSTMAIHCVLFGTMALVHGVGSTRNATFDHGTLTLDDVALSLDGRPIVRRDELRQAFVVPTGEAILVRLERRGRLQRPLFVRVRDHDEAAALLGQLGFDAEHTTAEMRIASGLLAMPAAKQLLLVLLPLPVFLPGVLFASVAHSATLVFAMVAALLAYTFGISLTPSTVRIGTDGIVTRWFGRTRFIEHARIQSVKTYDEYISSKRQRGVRLVLDTGEEVRLPTGQMDVGEAEAARLAQRIEEARDAHRRGAAGGATDVLARGDRDVATWVRFLRGVGAGAVGPRTPAVPRDVLLRIVEDSRAAPIERASAAVAAIASGDEDAKKRVRIAAEATASPKLRVALDRIADTRDEQALAEALADLDALSAERR